MIDYDPKDANHLWDEGVYDAVLSEVSEKYSKSSGKPMYVLQFTAFSGDDKMTIRDFVVIPSALWKLKELASLFGQSDVFDAGNFDPYMLKGKSLKLSLTIQDNKEYGEQNRIGAYVKSGSAASAHAQKQTKRDVPPDDDFAF